MTLDVDSKNLCELGLQHSPSELSTLTVFDGFLHMVLLRVGQFADNLECRVGSTRLWVPILSDITVGHLFVRLPCFLDLLFHLFMLLGPAIGQPLHDKVFLRIPNSTGRRTRPSLTETKTVTANL